MFSFWFKILLKAPCSQPPRLGRKGTASRRTPRFSSQKTPIFSVSAAGSWGGSHGIGYCRLCPGHRVLPLAGTRRDREATSLPQDHPESRSPPVGKWICVRIGQREEMEKLSRCIHYSKKQPRHISRLLEPRGHWPSQGHQVTLVRQMPVWAGGFRFPMCQEQPGTTVPTEQPPAATSSSTHAAPSLRSQPRRDHAQNKRRQGSEARGNGLRWGSSGVTQAPLGLSCGGRGRLAAAAARHPAPSPSWATGPAGEGKGRPRMFPAWSPGGSDVRNATKLGVSAQKGMVIALAPHSPGPP